MSIAMPADPSSPYPDQPENGPAFKGRLRDNRANESDRNYAVAMHLTPLAGLVVGPLFFITPLILWLMRKDESTFDDDHGREVINFGLSYLLFAVIFSWTVVIPVALILIGLINMIRGAVAASKAEYFRYPLTIRFLS